MKILGLTYNRHLLLKGDSALLVNRKPFFIPDGVTRLIAYPALALRVSRLGKNIAPKFADRYYNAVALALDIQAANLRDELASQGAPWTAAASLDGSFPVGNFMDFNSSPKIGVKLSSTACGSFWDCDREPVALVAREAIVRRKEFLRQGAEGQRSMKSARFEVSRPEGPISLSCPISLSSAAEAVARASALMTIRQGDIIYLPLQAEPIDLHLEDVVTGYLELQEQPCPSSVGEEQPAEPNLFCRIK